MEKSKRKSGNKNTIEDDAEKAQQRLVKKVTTLMKEQKVQLLRKIVKGQDDSKPWGLDMQVKVCNPTSDS